MSLSTVKKGPSFVEGRVTVRDSATVICLRRRPTEFSPRKEVSAESIGRVYYGESGRPQALNAVKHPIVGKLLAEGPLCFYAGWEVLLGQNEVINYLKSSPKALARMRYGGEFKLAGGNVEKGEGLEECAKRELLEEFLTPAGISLPRDEIKLRPFSLKESLPIRSVGNVIHNFVCLEEENPFLQTLDIEEVNERLRANRRAFESKLEDNSFWDLPLEEKERISPEVHSLRWMPLSEAVELSLSSFFPKYFVNEWQKRELDFLSSMNLGKMRPKRDPMLVTAFTLLEIEMFPTAQSLLNKCRTVSLEELRKSPDLLLRQGMTNDEVIAGLKIYLKKGGYYSSFTNKTLNEGRAANSLSANL